jgi:hypothetical protein
MRARRRKGPATARLRRLRPCPAFATRLADRVFDREDLNRRTDMQGLKPLLALTAGAICLALAILILLSLPGFLSDADSVVPVRHVVEARQ